MGEEESFREQMRMKGTRTSLCQDLLMTSLSQQSLSTALITERQTESPSPQRLEAVLRAALATDCRDLWARDVLVLYKTNSRMCGG